jgi:SMC interacting uncharacterized protein involved in chromosome segregation
MVKKLKELEDDLDNFRSVQYRMDNEGIDYCFEHYSSFEEIQDEEFHKLRKEFLESMNNMRSYVENKIEDLKSQVDELEWGDY